MYCMKCGRETQEGSVFCQACLEVMEKHPVKPGTPVHIPKQAPAQVSKKPQRSRRALEPEELIRRLKRAVTVAVIAVFVTLVMWGVTIAMLVHVLNEQKKPPIGQNYSVSTSAAGTNTGP